MRDPPSNRFGKTADGRGRAACGLELKPSVANATRAAPVWAPPRSASLSAVLLDLERELLPSGVVAGEVADQLVAPWLEVCADRLAGPCGEVAALGEERALV